MVSVMDVCKKLALLGRADAYQLSLQLSCRVSLIEAILDRLVRMGKITKIQLPREDYCCSITCNAKGCSTKQPCYSIVYQLSQNSKITFQK
ncbi:MAG: FeoC-like transcriptional regulator [Candidatus Dasytiphilus stammeri]